MNILKLQIKTCPVCKREFNNRKRWNSRGIWDEVVYCSERCRKYKNNKKMV